jgi:hypothetical protein
MNDYEYNFMDNYEDLYGMDGVDGNPGVKDIYSSNDTDLYLQEKQQREQIAQQNYQTQLNQINQQQHAAAQPIQNPTQGFQGYAGYRLTGQPPNLPLYNPNQNNDYENEQNKLNKQHELDKIRTAGFQYYYHEIRSALFNLFTKVYGRQFEMYGSGKHEFINWDTFLPDLTRPWTRTELWSHPDPISAIPLNMRTNASIKNLDEEFEEECRKIRNRYLDKIDNVLIANNPKAKKLLEEVRPVTFKQSQFKRRDPYHYDGGGKKKSKKSKKSKRSKRSKK